MIVRTEAVVLRTLAYGETSLIVTLFTREKGVVAVLARGARLPKSRFGATLQPMAYVQALFYYKPTRSLQTLTESAHVQAFHHLGRNLGKIAVGLRLVELTHALLQPEEPAPSVFNLLVGTLAYLDATERAVEHALPWYQLHLGAALGFAPAFAKADVEAVTGETGILTLDTGAMLPAGALPAAARQASRAALRAFAIFARADLETALRLHLAPAVRREVDALVEAFLRYHVEEAYPTRSEAVLGRLREAIGPPQA